MTDEEKRKIWYELSPERKHEMIIDMLNKRRPSYEDYESGAISRNEKYDQTSMATYKFILDIKNEIITNNPTYISLGKKASKHFYFDMIDLMDDFILPIEDGLSYFNGVKLEKTYTTVPKPLKTKFEDLKVEYYLTNMRDVLIIIYANYLEHNPKWKKHVFEKLYIE